MKDAISENNQGSVFQSKLAYKSTEAKRILSEVEERHQNVVRMAQSIQELQQLFLDMQSMVQAQDSLVIQVSDSMSRAKDNTEQATKEMAQAVTNKKASRKVYSFSIHSGAHLMFVCRKCAFSFGASSCCSWWSASWFSSNSASQPLMRKTERVEFNQLQSAYNGIPILAFQSEQSSFLLLKAIIVLE